MHIDYRLALRRLTTALLLPDASYQQMFDAAEELYRLFSAAASMRADDPKHQTDLFLSEGKAIAPAWAAMCVKDFYRTRQFLRGLIAAIRATGPKFPGTPVHILYAGTGPFATLALPLTTLFTPAEVQFTFLEINPESVRLLRNVLSAFQAGTYVRNIEQTDAAVYQANEPVHIVLTETMQQALQDEPQVAITRNLAPQLVPGGALIPESVLVSSGLFNVRNLMDAHPTGTACGPFSPLFELSARTLPTDEPGRFPEKVFDLPEQPEAGYFQFCLFTEIRVFDDLWLRTGDSGLTQPKILFEAGPDGKFNVQRVGLRYVMEQKPGFRVRTFPAVV